MNHAEFLDIAGPPGEWLMVIVYRRDGHCMVWGDESIDAASAAEAVAETAAQMSVEYPGGDVPSGWN